jgi:hypothetical protein
MFADQLGHFKHRHLLLAVEYLQELVIGVDVSPVLGILQIVLLDVDPDLLGDLGSGYRLAANNSGQSVVRLHGLHESGVWFALTLPRSFLLCHIQYPPNKTDMEKKKNQLRKKLTGERAYVKSTNEKEEEKYFQHNRQKMLKAHSFVNKSVFDEMTCRIYER